MNKRGDFNMEIKACKRCGRMFQYITGKPICPRCKKDEEEIFQKVKEYLRENVGATTQEVCEATGATVGMIQGFLREGRLEVTAHSPLALNCEQCGIKIRTGRMCDQCKAKLGNAFEGAVKSMKTLKPAEHKEKERMRFLDSHK